MDKVSDYYLMCGIKKGWHSKSLDDFTNDDEALAHVKNYLRKFAEAKESGVGLYLWGSNGTGKTHLMCCAFKELISRKQTVRVFTIDEIVDQFTASWYSPEHKRELNHMLRTVDFLGIDEFGKNVGKDGEAIYLPDMVKRIMESVIHFRVQMKRPIWFSSNTDPKFVREVFSEDIASLLNEAVIDVCVRGEDYRKIVQRNNKKRFL